MLFEQDDAVPSRYRILVATPQTLVLDLLPAILRPEFEVVGGASDSATAVEIAFAQTPDIALLDADQLGLDGVEACIRISRMQTRTRVVCMAEDDSPDRAARAFECGAAGYVLKAHPTEELLKALRAVATGGVYLTPAIAKGDVTGLPRARGEEPSRTLSIREHEVLRLVLGGLSMAEVGRQLGISPRTVAFHKYRGMRVLGLRRRSDLVALAARQGLMAYQPS